MAIPTSSDQENILTRERQSRTLSISETENSSSEISIESDLSSTERSFTPDKSIYENSNIGNKEFVIALYSIIIKHKLSNNAVDDLLNLLQLILPKKNNLPSNHKVLYKIFYKFDELNLYNLCSTCDKIYEEVNFNGNIENKKLCLNCNKIQEQFVTFDILTQLKTILTKVKLKDISENINRHRSKKMTF